MPDYLGRDGLHDEDGVGAHAIAIVKGLWHAKDHHVVLFLRPVDIGAAVSHFPGKRLNLVSCAAKDCNLALVGVEHRIATEELLAHALFHVLTDGIELVAHEAVRAYWHKIRPMHHRGRVVGTDALPMCDARGAVLVATRIAAIGIAEHVPDEHCKIGLKDFFIHDDMRMVGFFIAKIDQVGPVFAIVIDDLPSGPKSIEDSVAKEASDFFLSIFAMEAVGADKFDVFFLDAGAAAFFDDKGDGDFSMGVGLGAPFYPIGKHDDDL